MSKPDDRRELVVAPGPDFSSVPSTQRSRAVFLPENLGQAMELAHFMAGGIGVRQWMRGNPSACLALIQISMRWGMDPYIVSNKAYYANDTLSFEAQLVNAVLNTCGELIGRLKVEFVGDAEGGKGKESLNCRVSGRIKADPEQLFVHEQALCTIAVRNSPLWTVNPRQQLQYYTTRAWARLYLPEVLLGIYTPDEVADGVAARIEQESTPKDDTPAPDRRNFENAQTEAQDADFAEIETVLPENAASAEENSETRPEEAQNGENDGPAVDLGAENEGSGDVQPVEESDSAVHVDAGAAEPAVEDEPQGEPLPVEPLEWAVWEREIAAEIEALSDQDGFNTLRRRIQPALDAAADDLLDRIQDLLADKLATLPEKSA